MADEDIPPERTFPWRDVEAAQRQSREQHRQFLIDSVWNDEMLPSDAEARAAANGIDLAASNQPGMLYSSKWSLAQAVVWIAWRDPDRIHKQWGRLHDWSGSLWRDPPSEHQVETLERSEIQIWEALEAGRIEAVGLQGQGPKPVRIDALDWSNLEWMPDKKKLSVRYFGHPDPAFRCVTVKSAEVLSIWPSKGERPPAAESPRITEPAKRGGAGPKVGPVIEALRQRYATRPSSKNRVFLLAELKRHLGFEVSGSTLDRAWSDAWPSAK